LPLFRTALVGRSAYREMLLNGRPPTISEAGKAAGADVESLPAEIRAILEGASDDLSKAG